MAYDKNGNIIRTSSKDVEIDALGGVTLDDAVKQKMFGNDVKDTLEGGEHNAPPSVAAVNTGLSKKADKADIESKLSTKADKSSVDATLTDKASKSELASKQEKLVSGSNIKTINNQPILGSGNINIQGGGGGGSVDIDTAIPALPSDSKVPSTKMLVDNFARKGSGGGVVPDADEIPYKDTNVGTKLTELDGVAPTEVSNTEYDYAISASNNNVLFGIRKNGECYIPNLDSKSIDAIKPIIVSKSGRGHFKNLVEAILKAEEQMFSVVYVEDGTYDMYEEIAEVWGADYFEKMSGTGLNNWGVRLCNGIKIIFAQSTSVTFEYNGSNADVYKVFSPFYIGQVGFELRGLNIRTKNCRYCIHDDASGTTAPYYSRYVNCRFYTDNSENPYWTSEACIGGGLGKQGTINIEGCYFNTCGQFRSPLSYHNYGGAGGENAQSVLYITNNYTECGTLRISNHGTGEKLSHVFACGNSFANDIIFNFETDNDKVVNFEIIEWNNVIRDV